MDKLSSTHLQFLGGAETVTGSKFLLTVGKRKILIDCGLFQGVKNLREKNWIPLSVRPADIEAVILTHAHIDHSGYLPKLVKDGFQGKIYSTFATRSLSSILLKDCAYLMEEDAAYFNRTGHTKHLPALPLFTQEDADRAMEHFHPQDFERYVDLGGGIGFEFYYVGHILGATFVVFNMDGKKIAFTGDVGRSNDDILYPPKPIPPIDYLVSESTYGNRLHSQEDLIGKLQKIIIDSYFKKGVILIPAFAVGRSLHIMHYLSVLAKNNRIPNIPIYLNSPMAQDFTKIFLEYRALHKLKEEECLDIFKQVKFIRNTDESKALNLRDGPMIIISASGMLSGGRILHHIKEFATRPTTTIILTGYQAPGTRGEALQQGAKELKIHGSYFPVRARIESLDMSAHADYSELIQWFFESKIHPKKVFLVHGNASASDDLRRRLNEVFGWNCSVPEHNSVEEIEM